MPDQLQLLEVVVGTVSIFIGILTGIMQVAPRQYRQADLLATPLRHLRWLAMSLVGLLLSQTIDIFGPRMFRMEAGFLRVSPIDFRLRDGVTLFVSVMAMLVLSTYIK